MVINTILLAIFLLYTFSARLFLNFDGRGRFLTFAVVISLVYNLNSNVQWRRLLFGKPIIIWLVWIIYTLINTYNHGFLHYSTLNGPRIIYLDQFIFHTLLLPLVIIVTVSDLYLKNPRFLLKNLSYIYIFFLVAVYVFDGFSTAYGRTRFGAIVGNEGSNTIVGASFVWLLCILNNVNKKNILIASIVFGLMFVILSQTRKAFTGVSILILFYYLSKLNLRYVKNWFLILFVFIFGYIAIAYVMENTELGARFSTVESQGIKHSEVPAYLTFLGDRAWQVYTGWKIWLMHPLFGVGLTNAPYYSHLPYVFHNEYIGQLSEGGIIGFLLYAWFYFQIIKGIFKIKSRDKYNHKIFLLGGIIAVLFVSMYSWTYNVEYVFVILGICVGSIKRNQLVRNL